MNTPKDLQFLDFQSTFNPLNEIHTEIGSGQSKYLLKYLANLGAQKVLVESNYFDRDFLSEFSAFYCLSAKGYPNVCKRLHFFSTDTLNRESFTVAIGGDEVVQQVFQDTYLGFIIIRPITESPFGRTVLKWYPDKTPDTPRVISPSRNYIISLAGIELSVNGLAWQQQDSGVAACATIGIWSMLHSSAFNARNAIPTTSMITEAAHSSALVGRPPYPSHFLQYEQIQHAIMQLGFSPAVTNGNLPGRFFSKDRFANTCAAYLRSGYPLLIGAIHGDGVAVGHAVCAVGFRETAPQEEMDPNKIYLQDDNVLYLYIHDDNIGPNVRFKLTSETYSTGPGEEAERCVLVMDTPEYLLGDTRVTNGMKLFPSSLVAAVHEDLKITSDSFFQHGIGLTEQLKTALQEYLIANNVESKPLVISTRFLMLKDYLSTELKRQLESESALLARTRIQLQEKVPPMSLHLAILRIALPDASILVDIIYDTTDTDKNRSVFAHVVYDITFNTFLSQLPPSIRKKLFGVLVEAYS